jgi:hypothetical protein
MAPQARVSQKPLHIRDEVVTKTYTGLAPDVAPLDRR